VKILSLFESSKKERKKENGGETKLRKIAVNQGNIFGYDTREKQWHSDVKSDIMRQDSF